VSNAEIVCEAAALGLSKLQGGHGPDCRRLVLAIICRLCASVPRRRLVCLDKIGLLTLGAKKAGSYTGKSSRSSADDGTLYDGYRNGDG